MSTGKIYIFIYNPFQVNILFLYTQKTGGFQIFSGVKKEKFVRNGLKLICTSSLHKNTSHEVRVSSNLIDFCTRGTNRIAGNSRVIFSISRYLKSMIGNYCLILLMEPCFFLKTFLVWDKVFKIGPSKICGRQP